MPWRAERLSGHTQGAYRNGGLRGQGIREIIWKNEDMKNPVKFCECGCGKPAPISTRNRWGYRVGQPMRFIHGHSKHGKPPVLRAEKNPRWNGYKITRRKDGYIALHLPDHPRASNGYVLEHVLVAEKALGRPLPEGAQVHHWADVSDNTKLVICPTDAYHKMLHQRERALDACGHADWLRCRRCKSYSPASQLKISKGGFASHPECLRQASRKAYAKRTGRA